MFEIWGWANIWCVCDTILDYKWICPVSNLYTHKAQTNTKVTWSIPREHWRHFNRHVWPWKFMSSFRCFYCFNNFTHICRVYCCAKKVDKAARGTSVTTATAIRPSPDSKTTFHASIIPVGANVLSPYHVIPSAPAQAIETISSHKPKIHYVRPRNRPATRRNNFLLA